MGKEGAIQLAPLTYIILTRRRNYVDKLIGTQVQLSSLEVLFGVGGEAPFALGLLHNVLDILGFGHLGDGVSEERRGTQLRRKDALCAMRVNRCEWISANA